MEIFSICSQYMNNMFVIREQLMSLLPWDGGLTTRAKNRGEPEI